MRSARLCRCFPSPSKFSGASHCSYARFKRGHSAVDDGEPGRVAVAALVDHRLPEQPLVLEAQPQRRRPRRRIERVALPLVAPVAELVEHARHHQEHGLGGGRRPLQQRRVVDVADLDHAVGPIDAHEGRHADGLAGLQIDDGCETAGRRPWPPAPATRGRRRNRRTAPGTDTSSCVRPYRACSPQTDPPHAAPDPAAPPCKTAPPSPSAAARAAWSIRAAIGLSAGECLTFVLSRHCHPGTCCRDPADRRTPEQAAHWTPGTRPGVTTAANSSPCSSS